MVKPGKSFLRRLPGRRCHLYATEPGTLGKFCPEPVNADHSSSVSAVFDTGLEQVSNFQAGIFYHSDLDQGLFGVEGLMDFSASIDQQAIPWRLKIETWMLHGWDSSTREKLLKSFEQIPLIQQSILAGLLTVEFSEMMKPVSERVGYLSKRRIQSREDSA